MSTQRELLTSYREEMQRTGDFRIRAMELQQAAARKGTFVIIAMIVAVALIMLTVVSRMSQV